MTNAIFHYGPTKEEWLAKYDTVAGITKLIKTYEEFRELVYSRSRASLHKEHPKNDMHTFVVLGKWHLNERGNTQRAKYHLSWSMMLDVPKVASVEDFNAWALTKGVDLTKIRDLNLNTWMAGVIDKLVPPQCVCEECRVGWTMENAEDLEVDRHFTDVDGSEFVGKTLEEVEVYLNSLPGDHHTLGDRPALRNDRYIDLTPLAHMPTTPRNFKGEFWSAGLRIDMSYVVQEGDVLQVEIIKFRHKLCSHYLGVRKEEAFFRELLVEAGVEVETLIAIPNEHMPSVPPNPNQPWFLLNRVVKVGYLYQGWEINWSPTGKDLSALFEGEDVKKGPTFIWAKGEYGKTRGMFKRYIRTVTDALKVT